MNQQREHVVLCPEIAHVVLEAARISPDAPSAQHLHDVAPQAIIIHVHINLQRIVSLRGSPVIRENPAEHGFHHGFRIVDMPVFPELVPVIPMTGLFKVHVIPCAQFLDLFFRKASVFFQHPLVCHGVFQEHVQCGMCPILLHRQDARHISQRDIRLVFQEIAQEIKVLFLQRLGFLPFAHDAVPLINQEDELPACICVNPFKRFCQDGCLCRNELAVCVSQLLYHSQLQIFRYILPFGANQELLHIQINDVILVQMLPKGIIAAYLQSREQLPGVTAAAVIGGKHLKRHGFPETPGPADAHKALLCVDASICK